MLTNSVRNRTILLSLIASLSILGSEPAAQSSVSDIVVNTTSDAADFGGAPQIGNLPGPDGLVSLREAIIAANNTPGPQTIAFNILLGDPGFDGNVFTIKPQGTALPNLLDHGTTIDGTTQTAFSGDTNLFGPEIVLDGSQAGAVQPGLSIFASNDNTVRGLVIHSFGGAGIQFFFDPNNPALGPNNNKIVRCYLGTDETGAVIRGNGWQGVAVNGRGNLIGVPGQGNLISGNHIAEVDVGGSENRLEGNLIGTDRTGMVALGNIAEGLHIGGANNFIGGNLISGNHIAGVDVLGSENRLEGNLIGTDRTGMVALGNIGFGLLIQGANNFIGGARHGAGNVVSGNTDNGVVITGSGNRVYSNFIGTDIAGNNPLPNGTLGGGSGVQVVFDASDNVVSENRIAFNNSDGVVVGFGAVRNTLAKNSIFSNAGLGIDLGSGGEDDFHGDGVTANDAGDFDTGPNDLMNFPVLDSAHAAPGSLIVRGMIDTPNPRTVTIEFFANPLPVPGGDPSGHGEGAIFLGTVRPNAHGKFTAAVRPVPVGALISATATDADGNTSEFSANIAASFSR